MNFSKTYVLGRVIHTPELKSLENGNKVVTFSMATNRFWKDKSGKQEESVEFHNMVAFGKLAETIGKYVEGGQLLFVEGRNQTRSWEDKNDGGKRYRTEIMVEGFQFGEKAKNREAKKKEEPSIQPGGYTGDIHSPMDYGDTSINIDDIPF